MTTTMHDNVCTTSVLVLFIAQFVWLFNDFVYSINFKKKDCLFPPVKPIQLGHYVIKRLKRQMSLYVVKHTTKDNNGICLIVKLVACTQLDYQMLTLQTKITYAVNTMGVLPDT